MMAWQLCGRELSEQMAAGSRYGSSSTRSHKLRLPFKS